MLTDLLYVVALPGEQEVLPIKKAEEESKTGKIPMGFLVPQPGIDISLAGMGHVALPYYGRAEEDRALCIWWGRSGDRPPPVTSTAECAMLCSLSGLASSWACLASRPTPGLALDREMLMRGEAAGTLRGQPPTARLGGPAGEEDGEERRGRVSQCCVGRGSAPCLGLPTRPGGANSLAFSNEFPYLPFLTGCIHFKGLTTREE